MAIKVVYWTGTGNTQVMADSVVAGVKKGGADAEAVFVDNTTADALATEDKFALGCPAMGAEVLEEASMEPFVTALEGKVSGKKIALFGSYDWGDGQWMRDWVSRMQSAGATIVNGEGLIANNAPTDDDKAACEALGEALAKA